MSSGQVIRLLITAALAINLSAPVHSQAGIINKAKSAGISAKNQCLDYLDKIANTPENLKKYYKDVKKVVLTESGAVGKPDDAPAESSDNEPTDSKIQRLRNI